MRLDRFTLRGQEAIQAGIELAERNQNQQVEPEHLLCAMLEQPEGIVRPLLGKLGANVQVVLNDCQAAVARFPRVHYLADTLAHFRLHDASKTMSQGPRFRSEQTAGLAALAADPAYPLRINRAAKLSILEGALPLMCGGQVVFVTSHWAHLYGQVAQLPRYAAVAETKHAGEQALRGRQAALARRGIRLLVVTGDPVEGTITPKLLELAAPGLTAARQEKIGGLPDTRQMAEAIVMAAMDPALASGHTVVVGGALDSLPRSGTGH